jgi:pimeloyl-ACP methyl ester carboxylesterase
MTRGVTEQAILFGPRQSLVGILARPGTPAPPDRIAIVILNTGIIHRVGHHRMWVTISRALAGLGHTVLRFDFSGIGDSDPRNDNLSPLQSCLADIKEAMDWLEANRHATRVVVVGLCSGADHAVLYGHTDPRVCGLVLMDPSIPATVRFYLHYMTPRLTHLRNWVTVLTGRSRMLNSLIDEFLHAAQPKHKSEELTLQNLRFHPQLEKSYQNAVAAGIEILAIFTGESTRQTYREQILDAFPNVSFGDQLRLEFFAGSDHTFARQADRDTLTRLLLEWVAAITCRSNEQVPPLAC